MARLARDPGRGHHPRMELDAWHAQGRIYRHHGRPIFYADAGEGEALLLIHGFPTASWDWHALWPALTERFRCIAPDMLGFGFSAKPPGHDYRIAEQADLHEGLLDELGIERCHVLAHDYGDTVAQELLARDLDRREAGRPGRIASLCLLNGGLFPETHRPRPIQRLLIGPLGPALVRLLSRGSFERNMRRIFGPDTPPSEADLAAFWKLARRDNGLRAYPKLIRYMQERQAHRARWVSALADAPVPLRLIDGVQDPVSGGHMAARYRELVPAADVVELACGHYPQLELPEATLAAFLAFHERPDLARG